ncbi:MAG TPA: response regulator [Candidatus Desulfofervidus auxilii]|uniref:Response regulator n=1 Tax=Desulfofervidus auxilii TaxID=1621989 RepID=A0A7C0Y4S8_DESA2|nr:response regulator [Candidatus Desulfofervidus auxilii]HDD44361.1 response regulator [Candidatus Desulfofervidus auxilii]
MQRLHNILVVDDEVSILTAIKRLFKSFPLINCFTTTSPKEALKIMANKEIDLIVTDQRMPEMTGIELLREVTAKYPDVIKIILTAYSDIDVILKAINEIGIYKFILKPWDNQDLRLTIIRALEWKETLEENKSLQQELKKRQAILSYWEHKYPGISKVQIDEDGEVYVELEMEE